MDCRDSCFPPVREDRFDVVLIHIDNFYDPSTSSFNIGLLYIATVLKEKGYRVRCLGAPEMNRMSYDDFRQLIRRASPSLVGFNTVSDNIFEVQDYATLIKRWSPRSTIVVGGPYASAMGEKTLDHKAFDISVPGEGEYIMLQLAEWKIRRQGNLEEIPGIIFRLGDEIISTSEPQLIENINELPLPDRSLVGYDRVIRVVSARGCPFHCAFCFKAVHGRRYRTRNSADIASEIRTMIEANDHPAVDIIDECFIGDVKRVKDICSRLAEYRSDTGKPYIMFVQGRANIICKHPEILEYLKAAGVANILMGIESGCQETLDYYNKKLTVEQIRQAVKHVYDTGGMTVLGNFLFGGPFEDETSFQANVDLAEELIAMAPGVVELRRIFLAPYPGTRIFQHPEQFGLTILDDQFKKAPSYQQVSTVSEFFDPYRLQTKVLDFDDRVLQEAMERNADRIPREMVLKHLEWMYEFKFPSVWFSRILHKKRAILNYYFLLKSPRYSTFEEIPRNFLYQWYPQRTSGKPYYSSDGKKLILRDGLQDIEIENPEERLIVELCSGRLNIKRMLDEFIRETGTDKSREEIFTTQFIPLFKKMEELFYQVFHW